MMTKNRIPSPTSSLTVANPVALSNGVQPENTDPLHDEDNPLYDYRFRAVIPEPDEEFDDVDEDDGVESMEYDPIDQDNTTNP